MQGTYIKIVWIQFVISVVRVMSISVKQICVLIVWKEVFFMEMEKKIVQ